MFSNKLLLHSRDSRHMPARSAAGEPIAHTAELCIAFSQWLMRSLLEAIVVICAVGCARGALAQSTPQGDQVQSPPEIENGDLKISFNGSHGDLMQLSDAGNHRDFLDGHSRLALWQITFADGGQLSPRDAKSFAWNNDHGRMVLLWSQFENREDGLQVTASATIDSEEPLSRWHISVDGIQRGAVRTVAFPRIGPVAPRDHETLVVPQWIGEITSRARQIVNPAPNKPTHRHWDYPGDLSMQFVAFYDHAGPGVLVATDDTQLLRKQFAIFGDGANGLGLEVIHHVPQVRNSASSYKLPYAVTVRAFTGDWFTAAEHYRNWARQQPWVRESRVRKHQSPEWVRNTALWVWNRGASSQVLTPALALQEHAGLPVSVFWHWWHGCAYDVGFPEYLPPREGTETFTTAVAAAQAHGVRAIVYMNQRLWGMTTKSWNAENAAAWAVKEADGTIRPEIYNTFTKAPCASMCMGTSFWRNRYAGLAERAVKELGVAGIYMDQACTSRACYDPSHGHPLGGGAYWMEGFQELEQDIRRRCGSGKDVALAGEGCGEGWLPHLDIMLSLQVSMERYASPGEWEPVPLFNVVYHDCATQFGNYSSLTRPPYDDLWPGEFAPAEPLALLDRKFAAQFRLEQARAFLWGQQPTIANIQVRQLQERPAEIAFLLRLARLRMKALPYLRDGVCLRPPVIDSPRIEIPVSRLSIYAGQQDAVKEYRKTVPSVLASAFQAANGDIALVLVNIADQPISLSVPLKGSGWPLPPNGAVYQLTETGRGRIAAFRTEIERLPLSLESCDAAIYEFVAE